MNPSENGTPLSRRELGKRVGQIAAASALAGVAVPLVHAAGDSTTQLALIGCGGRGSGAAADALRVKFGKTKLVAMADAFEDRLSNSYKGLSNDGFLAGKILLQVEGFELFIRKFELHPLAK